MNEKPERARHLDQLWGSAPSKRYSELRQRFTPIFETIREGALSAELERQLPFDAIRDLKRAGFTAIRVACATGGSGASLVELLALVVDLAAADSNVAQALRAHFGFVEHLLAEDDGPYRARWLERVVQGDIAGAAAAEVGGASRDRFGTRLSLRDTQWSLHGTKYFTTGSLYADWLTVTATTEDGQTAKCLASRHDPGLEIVDDWDGMGQRLTASGTAHFDNVRVEKEDILFGNTAFPYSQAFFQLYHLATVVGIARAASQEISELVGRRRRSFTHGNGDLPSGDPQILEIVGRVCSAAYVAGAVVASATRTLQSAADCDEDEREALVARAELEVWQAQDQIFPMLLEATSLMFDALSGSATLRTNGLDRYWRNIRTIAGHNPRVYRTRIVGDFAVNGTRPPGQWRVGVADAS